MSSPKRDVFVAAGMAVSAASAAVSSFEGLRSLAVLAGWSVYMAPLLPLTIDAYAMSATRVWLSESTASSRARRFARRNAVGAILASLLGNAMYHVIAAGLLGMSWVVVVVVGGIPPVVLGLVSHLAVLRRQSDLPVPQAVPGTNHTAPGAVPRPEDEASKRQPRTEDELLVAARTADVRHRAEHGKPITRDALRRELRVGGGRATALLRRLKETEGGSTASLSIPHQNRS
ncbi:DUF2637 domain-containing protein [Phytohabitans sp. ZYX-F-186]|uniref:DUF2637 domain-containing protein n=1 Tax=Phytohabitans maris TaxID=3071409 RepID=A0ABU0Z7P9_9ACTN|nr:DUF2637 domain-containing protein [Phytohabitans sp. ZYX-F-186]MDQ7903086.1 DUF2637 domain-containing protein [Phytohabitans sp. ZYX-F-186]